MLNTTSIEVVSNTHALTWFEATQLTRENFELWCFNASLHEDFKRGNTLNPKLTLET